jgi:hypothetical protein
MLVLLSGITMAACTPNNPETLTSLETITATRTVTRTITAPTVTETITLPPLTVTKTSTLTVTANPVDDNSEPYMVVEPVWFELIHADGGDMTFDWHTAVKNLTNTELHLYLRVDFLARGGSYAWDFAIITIQPDQIYYVTGQETMIAEYGNQLNGIELTVKVI